ncbi:uncharacterized protein BDZ99DRAFT_538505 [Mytilinidion resinicola]|uniref:C2H2-type domain-containing protein n=1 Tax=Mytilinidion resinicola TaxID=574789 RepID=A0A6A6YBV5_9PEZI|nr:uncharacterized protein BDZ99DRAFT_538505 [Mytilinidion resinicola]KAF2806292.1 hypothetical protein BDZ99DRAFT_538505 [Mytilinidion resinicola]
MTHQGSSRLQHFLQAHAAQSPFFVTGLRPHRQLSKPVSGNLNVEIDNDGTESIPELIGSQTLHSDTSSAFSSNNSCPSIADPYPTIYEDVSDLESEACGMPTTRPLKGQLDLPSIVSDIARLTILANDLLGIVGRGTDMNASEEPNTARSSPDPSSHSQRHVLRYEDRTLGHDRPSFSDQNAELQSEAMAQCGFCDRTSETNTMLKDNTLLKEDLDWELIKTTGLESPEAPCPICKGHVVTSVLSQHTPVCEKLHHTAFRSLVKIPALERISEQLIKSLERGDELPAPEITHYRRSSRSGDHTILPYDSKILSTYSECPVSDKSSSNELFASPPSSKRRDKWTDNTKITKKRCLLCQLNPIFTFPRCDPPLNPFSWLEDPSISIRSNLSTIPSTPTELACDTQAYAKGQDADKSNGENHSKSINGLDECASEELSCKANIHFIPSASVHEAASDTSEATHKDTRIAITSATTPSEAEQMTKLNEQLVSRPSKEQGVSSAVQSTSDQSSQKLSSLVSGTGDQFSDQPKVTYKEHMIRAARFERFQKGAEARQRLAESLEPFSNLSIGGEPSGQSKLTFKERISRTQRHKRSYERAEARQRLAESLEPFFSNASIGGEPPDLSKLTFEQRISRAQRHKRFYERCEARRCSKVDEVGNELSLRANTNAPPATSYQQCDEPNPTTRGGLPTRVASEYTPVMHQRHRSYDASKSQSSNKAIAAKSTTLQETAPRETSKEYVIDCLKPECYAPVPSNTSKIIITASDPPTTRPSTGSGSFLASSSDSPDGTDEYSSDSDSSSFASSPGITGSASSIPIVQSVLLSAKKALVGRVMTEFYAMFETRHGIRMHAGEESTTNKPGSTPDRPRSNGGNNFTKRSVRGRNSAPPDDDDEDDSEKRRELGSTVHTSRPPYPSLRFACPYFKRNPTEHCTSRSCEYPGFKNVSRLKQHLYNCHALQNSCPRCWLVFETQVELHGHLGAPEACKAGHKPVKGFTYEQERQLRSKKRPRKPLTEEEKWAAVYRLLFPDDREEDIPSPYCNRRTSSEDGRIDSLASNEMALFEEFSRNEFPRLVQTEVEILIEQDAAKYASALVDLFRKCQDRLFEDFRKSRLNTPLPDAETIKFTEPIADGHNGRPREPFTWHTDEIQEERFKLFPPPPPADDLREWNLLDLHQNDYIGFGSNLGGSSNGQSYSGIESGYGSVDPDSLSAEQDSANTSGDVMIYQGNPGPVLHSSGEFRVPIRQTDYYQGTFDPLQITSGDLGETASYTGMANVELDLDQYLHDYQET